MNFQVRQGVEGLADLPLDAALHVDETCDRFESSFRSGTRPRIEDFVVDKRDPLRSVLFTELVKLEIQLRRKVDSDATIIGDEYRDRFPDFRAAVEAALMALAVPVLLPEQLRVQHDRQSVLAPKASHVAAASALSALMLPCKLGIYRLESEIGHGGMGTVYLALHPTLNRRVALKLMQPERMLKPEAVARFQREMKTVASLHHPNIVMAYDAGEANGRHFLAMEHVSGWDLASICRCYGTLPIPVACECIRQAALGLQHVYEHGFVHRDIKPSNLMLTKDGQVKLLDLGLARLRDDDQDERLTNDAPMGTIEYMAPEQAKDPHGVDIRADLYSLGCTLFKLLCGFSPFAKTGRNTMQLLSAHLQTPPPAVRDFREAVPTDLADLINRILRKDPPARPQTPSEVASALNPFASERILKSFAGTLHEISDVNGRLPEKPPDGLGMDTEQWQRSSDDHDQQFSDDSFSVPRRTDLESRPSREDSHNRIPSRRRWLVTAAVATVALTTAYFQPWRNEPAIDLLRQIDLRKNVLTGVWKNEQGVIVSPVNQPGLLRLTKVTAQDYQLDLTVNLANGKKHWTLVSTAVPRFAIDFRVTVKSTASESNPTEGGDSIPPNWKLDWDPSDQTSRHFELSVRDRRLMLRRDGTTIVEGIIPDGELSCNLPPEAKDQPGIYLLTDESVLKLSLAVLSSQEPH